MRDDTITREIREEYTPEELSERGKKLAGKMADIDAVASEKKTADATFNQRRQELEAEAQTLYQQINKGYEMAQIGCAIRYNDPAPGQKSYYRMDTSLCVETVEMTWEEKQEELQFNLNAAAEGQPQPSDEQVNDVLGALATDPEPEPELPTAGESREEFERDRNPPPEMLAPLEEHDGPGDAAEPEPEKPRRRRKPTPPPDASPTDPPEAARP